ncbi:MAG: T9SS type A sorting domain-containing protein [Bacteroidetes bacterium]|nr:T9SS type A sorting domain-containing protein [Bacteroidota bacterium]
METLKYILPSFFLALIISYSMFAQGPGKTSNPNPPDSSVQISMHIQEVAWNNPPGTNSNDVWIGIHPDYLTHIYSGSAITSIQIPSPLKYKKTYFWKVNTMDSSGVTEGDVWLFTTWHLFHPDDPFSFIDSFHTGTSNWNISNEGGDCIWDTIHIDDSNYDLPVTADGFVFSADSYSCGSGNTILSTATLVNPIDLHNSSEVFVFWDNDWNTTDSSDIALVEMSYDNDLSWITIWQRQGVSNRKNQVIVDITEIYRDNPFPLLFRLRTVQSSSESWWAIDNFYVIGSDILSPPPPASNLIAIGYSDLTTDSVWVELNWSPGGGVATGHRIKRKFGNEYSQYMYFNIAEVDINTSIYDDGTVNDETIYTYKIGIFEIPMFECWRYSNEATVLTPPIPVELISFTASVTVNDVHLIWSTATELNNSGFEIQKLNPPLNPLPGGGPKRWVKIGFVFGHGTTTEQQNYSFIDESVSSGKYQYRLKQIDYDGTFEYSDIVELEVGLPTEYSLEQNYPNPFNPSTTIQYAVSKRQFVTLKVYDVLGNEIATLVNEHKLAGSYEVEFNSMGLIHQTLTSGIYFYQLKAGSFVETKKMILLR